ncbi:MAG: Hpt domain-containing protein [Eubacteriales bacterium]|nr:Hpt domain-containing protein [Eubacteriales bacterium]
MGEIFDRVMALGADEKGIAGRFAGNIALYESCFTYFLEDPEHAALHNAITAENYGQAFESAHALKGTSGNMGLIAYYGAICALVESLRSGQYEQAANEYGEVEKQFDILLRLLSDYQNKGADEQ